MKEARHPLSPKKCVLYDSICIKSPKSTYREKRQVIGCLGHGGREGGTPKGHVGCVHDLDRGDGFRCVDMLKLIKRAVYGS